VRHNPIKDTLERTYLYADDIATDGGEPQPVSFEIGESLELENRRGERDNAIIKLIEGRTALINYEKLN
jgi:hypothetical protein